MKFVRINGPASQLNKLITACCLDGNFHPEYAGNFISQSMGYTALNEENPYSQLFANIKELASSLGVSLDDAKKIKGTVIDERTKEYISSIGETLNTLGEERKNLTEQLEQCKEGIEKYSHFTGLGVSLDEIFDCKFICPRFGFLPKDGYLKLNRGYSENPYILFCPCSSNDSGYWGAYFAPREREDEIDGIFAALHFERLHIPSAVGTTDDIIKSLEENIELVGERQKELDEKIMAIWEREGDRIKSLYLRLMELNSVFELRKYAVHHEKSCFFVGWIPASGEEKFRRRFEKYPEFVMEIEDPEKNSSPPVRLKNTILSRPYTYFVKMYGLPSYGDIDITAFVAATYTLLFGIMFGDVGQGFVLALGGLLAWKLKKIELGKILVPCGVSSMFFGFLFGSVFGFEELLDPVYHAMGMKSKPLSVMESINTVLLFAIGIGVSLVAVAIVISTITNLRKKKFGTALFSENGLAGLVVYIGGANLAYSFMAKEGIFPTGISVAMLLVGIVVLFCKELLAPLLDEGRFKKPESIGDFILQNLFECIEYILSYFSNTVSFLRVGAFVIVHASMMMVVFTLAGDTSTVKGMIVVVLGNIVVIALEGLLTGIQGLRLEFYEMFSRFYEGEGRPFEAAKIR